MDYCLAYITCSSQEEAARIARQLIEQKLAACVNIVDNITSVFEWDGQIGQEAELLLLAKTTDRQFPALCQKVSELHSYACPCITQIPLSGGHPPFFAWIDQQTGST